MRKISRPLLLALAIAICPRPDSFAEPATRELPEPTTIISLRMETSIDGGQSWRRAVIQEMVRRKP